MQTGRTLSDPDFRQVNQHMLHNPETARKDYLAANSKEEAVRAARNIRQSKKTALNLVRMLSVKLPSTNLSRYVHF